MKKLMFAVCICLLMSASAGMAASVPNAILTWGAWSGGYDMEEILEGYFPNYFPDFDNMKYSSDGLFSSADNWDMEEPWTLAFLTSSTRSNDGEWYLFANDGIDNFLTTPDAGGSFFDYWGMTGIFNAGGISFTNIFFTSEAFDFNGGTPAVPEPGSFLLLSTGVIGLGFAARRKLGAFLVK